MDKNNHIMQVEGLDINLERIDTLIKLLFDELEVLNWVLALAGLNGPDLTARAHVLADCIYEYNKDNKASTRGILEQHYSRATEKEGASIAKCS